MSTPTLYDALIAAGISVTSHESDLYCPVTMTTTAILAMYPLSQKIATIFRDNVTKQLCYDIPFAYEPWWKEKETKKIYTTL